MDPKIVTLSWFAMTHRAEVNQKQFKAINLPS